MSTKSLDERAEEALQRLEEFEGKEASPIRGEYFKAGYKAALAEIESQKWVRSLIARVVEEKRREKLEERKL